MTPVNRLLRRSTQCSGFLFSSDCSFPLGKERGLGVWFLLPASFFLWRCAQSGFFTGIGVGDGEGSRGVGSGVGVSSDMVRVSLI